MSSDARKPTLLMSPPIPARSPSPFQPSSPLPPVVDPPPFASFVHLLANSTADLTGLVQTLYTTAVYSTDPNTRQSAVELLTDHTALQQRLRDAEKRAVGKWHLHRPPPPLSTPTSRAVPSETPDTLIGSLTLTALSNSHVQGSLQFSLTDCYSIVSRSPQQQSSKLDPQGNVHMAFSVLLAPKMAVQEAMGGAGGRGKKAVEGVLNVAMNPEGERIGGDFMLSEEQLGVDDVEGDVIEFVGVKAQ